VLLVLFVCGEAIEDLPYTEIVPDRHIFANLPQVPGWGQLSVDNATQVLSLGVPGAFMLLGSDGKLYYSSSSASGQLKLKSVVSLGQQEVHLTLLKSSTAGSTIAVVCTTSDRSMIKTIKCSYAPSSEPTCSVSKELSASFAIGKVSTVVAALGQVFCAGELGLISWDPTTKVAPTWYLKQAVDALAVSASSSTIAAGSDEKLWLFDVTTSAASSLSSSSAATATATSHAADTTAASTAPNDRQYSSVEFKLTRWEWVTDIPSGAGGAVDDAITALAYDAEGALYIGTPTCLNVRWPNATFSRFDGDEGLPFANITAIVIATAVTPNGIVRRHAMDAKNHSVDTPVTQVWLGTTKGVVVLHGGAIAGGMLYGRASYHYGPRWHAGKRVQSMAAIAPAAAAVVHGAAVETGGETVVLLTDEGLTLLEQQSWTLGKKAAHYEALFPTGHYTRHNLVSGCDLTKYADLTTCTNHDNDNDGLWTSIIAGAEAFRFAVTKDPLAQAEALRFFSGLQLLNNVTGKPGRWIVT
jgi:hypothetical protein